MLRLQDDTVGDGEFSDELFRDLEDYEELEEKLTMAKKAPVAEKKEEVDDIPF